MKIWNCFSTAMALSPVFVLSFFHFVYFLSFNLRFNVTNPLVASCKQECKAIKSELPRIVQGYKQEPLQLTDPPALLQRKTNSQSKQQCLGVSALSFFFIIRRKPTCAKWIGDLGVMQNSTSEFLLCHRCSRILMSTGNGGSQNYSKHWGQSQRVELQGYILRFFCWWLVSFFFFF